MCETIVNEKLLPLPMLCVKFQEVCLLLNMESESIIEYEQLQEESIRIANSLSEMFIRQKIPVGIYSNAKDVLSGKSMHLLPGADRQHFTKIRESLARMDLTQPMDAFGTTSQRSEVVRVFERVSLHACGSFWILPLHGWNRKCSRQSLQRIRLYQKARYSPYECVKQDPEAMKQSSPKL